MKYYLYITKNNKNYNMNIYLFISPCAHHNTNHDFFSQCMLNERVMILCVVWKGFRHLPEILGEGVAPLTLVVLWYRKERGRNCWKGRRPTCVATVWWRTSESQKERVRERNRKYNYHEAHLKLNLRRSDPTAGDWHTLDGLCSITGEIHTYTHATCV